MTKLWLVSRTDVVGYDEYDSVVVAADTEEEARAIHPNGVAKAKLVDGYWRFFWDNPGSSIHSRRYDNYGWAYVTSLTVEYLGTTDRDIKGVVLASFNAG